MKVNRVQLSPIESNCKIALYLQAERASAGLVSARSQILLDGMMILWFVLGSCTQLKLRS